MLDDETAHQPDHIPPEMPVRPTMPHGEWGISATRDVRPDVHRRRSARSSVASIAAGLLLHGREAGAGTSAPSYLVVAMEGPVNSTPPEPLPCYGAIATTVLPRGPKSTATSSPGETGSWTIAPVIRRSPACRRSPMAPSSTATDRTSSAKSGEATASPRTRPLTISRALVLPPAGSERPKGPSLKAR